MTKAISASAGAAQTCWTYLAVSLEQARLAENCAASHVLRRRLADRLLAYERQAQTRRLPFTHDMLSASLCTSRATIISLLNDLTDEGMILAGRGWIAIENHEALGRQRAGAVRGCRSVAVQVWNFSSGCAGATLEVVSSNSRHCVSL